MSLRKVVVFAVIAALAISCVAAIETETDADVRHRKQECRNHGHHGDECVESTTTTTTTTTTTITTTTTTTITTTTTTTVNPWHFPVSMKKVKTLKVLSLLLMKAEAFTGMLKMPFLMKASFLNGGSRVFADLLDCQLGIIADVKCQAFSALTGKIPSFDKFSMPEITMPNLSSLRVPDLGLKKQLPMEDFVFPDLGFEVPDLMPQLDINKDILRRFDMGGDFGVDFKTNTEFSTNFGGGLNGVVQALRSANAPELMNGLDSLLPTQPTALDTFMGRLRGVDGQRIPSGSEVLFAIRDAELLNPAGEMLHSLRNGELEFEEIVNAREILGLYLDQFDFLVARRA